MDLCSISTIKDIQKLFGFKNAKSLGQNFLTDPGVIDAMVEAAEIGPDDLVIEIGPGIGVLTRGIAARAGEVIAVELDKALIPVLNFTLADFNNVEILNEDILKVDLTALIDEKGYSAEHVKIMGNLPYYITTPIITGLLENHVPAKYITIMMQKEVADRVRAVPGSKTFGALSVAVQFRSLVAEVVEVPRDSFFPAPKVDSEVLRLELLAEPAVAVNSQEMFFKVVKAGFGQRRKTLLNSLAGGGFDKDLVRSALEKAGIDEMRRAETLSLEEFAALADAMG